PKREFLMAGEQFTIDDELEALVRNRTADLLRSNERLRAEVERLSREYADTRQQLAEAISGRHTDREIRRAALNLMEDAVAARSAEHREILERRRAEEELRAADRQKDEFLATLAHELRNPLAPISSAIQVLQSRTEEDEELATLCDTIERQVRQLVRLVEDLLDVSRITRGSIVLRKEHVDLKSVVKMAIETSRTTIEARKHELVVSLPDEQVYLDGDPIRLSQIFSNLLNNAAKYTEPGGRISIE